MGEVLYLYLVVAEKVVSDVLMGEQDNNQFPIYFVSRALQGTEAQYPLIEKVTLSLVMAQGGRRAGPARPGPHLGPLFANLARSSPAWLRPTLAR